jgi:hypothetical protein
MNPQALGQLTLREMMLRSEVGNLNGEPAGQSSPLPLPAELGIAKVLGKNFLVRYELIGHLPILEQ